MGFFRFMAKNWRTTLAGAVTIVAAVPTIAPYVPILDTIVQANPQTKQDWLALAIAAAGAGLLRAKDDKVTGGVERQ